VFITSAYGLGEGVVQGAVNPDEFYVYKPGLREDRPAILKRAVGEKATKMVYTQDTTVGRTTEFVPVDPAEQAMLSLTDQQVEDLARQALIIEDHYGRPMDIEWGLDGADGGLFILQARPETVQSRAGTTVEKYILDSPGEVRAEGRAIGARIGAGSVRVLDSSERMHEFQAGEVLGADVTDPDWEPSRQRAGADAPHRGGRTRQAAAAVPATARSSPASWASRPLSAPGTPPRCCATGRRSPSAPPRATPASCTRGCWTSPSPPPRSMRCRRCAPRS